MLIDTQATLTSTSQDASSIPITSFLESGWVQSISRFILFSSIIVFFVQSLRATIMSRLLFKLNSLPSKSPYTAVGVSPAARSMPFSSGAV
jgi:hypothetical protein